MVPGEDLERADSLPSLSVTSAAVVMRTPDPGRKSIAQGVVKLATGVMANGRSPLAEGWAVVGVDAPQAASPSSSPAWIRRMCIKISSSHSELGRALAI